MLTSQLTRVSYQNTTQDTTLNQANSIVQRSYLSMGQADLLRQINQSTHVQQAAQLQQAINQSSRQQQVVRQRHSSISASAGQPSGQVLQRYKQGDTEQLGPIRISDNKDIIVKQSDGGKGSAPVFLAEADNNAFAALLPYKLVGDSFKFGDIDYYPISFDVPSIDDCGAYAHQVLKAMYGYNRRQHTDKRTVSSSGNQTTNPGALIKQDAVDKLAQVGDTFYVVNPPEDKETGKAHFNFHWAAIIGKSGRDVLTTEKASSSGPLMWFQLYDQDPKSFAANYITAGKLAKEAKAFIVHYTLQEKEQQKKQSQKVVDLIDLDSD